MRSSILTSKRAKALRRNMTDPEVMLWSRLKPRLADRPAFRSQHPMGPYILDFYCSAARLAVEIDGATHSDDPRIEHDERRDAWLKAQGVTVYRVRASSVFRDLTGVADGVRRLADELLAEKRGGAEQAAAPSTIGSSADGPPPPPLSRRGRQG